MTENLAAASGTFNLGGDLTVNRLGFGAMRITGEYILGSIVKDHAAAMVADGTAAGLSEGQIIGDLRQVFLTRQRGRLDPPTLRRLTHHQASRR